MDFRSIKTNMPEPKRLGYWLSEKKSRKMSLPDIEDSLRIRNIEAVKIDLKIPLSLQGPFDVILHKLTDIIAKAVLGDENAQLLLTDFEQYVADNPKVIVMDPIDRLRTLIDRFKTYTIIQNCEIKHQETVVFVPPFVALQSKNYNDNVSQLRMSDVSFPAVCKPIIAHGSSSAHQMTLIFNENGLADCVFPCVIQSFVNHNAVLYKLFAIGEKYYLVERPSIKNLSASEEFPSIHFDSGEVSKANSCSNLTLQENDGTTVADRQQPAWEILSRIIAEIHKAMGLTLFGVDVVVEDGTGRLAIVDVNSFPGYDGVADFSERLANFVRTQLDALDSNYKEVVGDTNDETEDQNRVKKGIEGANGTIPSRLIKKTSVA